MLNTVYVPRRACCDRCSVQRVLKGLRSSVWAVAAADISQEQTRVWLRKARLSMLGHLVAASEASQGKMNLMCRDLRAEKPRVASGGMLVFTASVDRVWAGLVVGAAVVIALDVLVPLKKLVAAGTHRLMEDYQGIVYGGVGGHFVARPPRQSLRDQSAVEY